MKELINKILLGSILITGLVFLFLHNNFNFVIAITHILFAWLFVFIINKIKINENYKTLVYIFLWFSFLGEIYFYRIFEYYDKILHLIVPFFITMMVYEYTKQFKIEYKKVFVFLTVLGMLALFELVEYSFDFILGLDMIGVQSRTGSVLLDSFTDTMFDLIFGGAGSLLYLIFKK